jgi:hypothetical protein
VRLDLVVQVIAQFLRKLALDATVAEKRTKAQANDLDQAHRLGRQAC